MKTIYNLIIYTLLFSCAHSVLATPALSQPESGYPIDYSIGKAEEMADQKQREAHQAAMLINNHYNKGKASYRSRRYKEAIRHFEKILEVDPAYEPAKLYIEGAIIQQRIAEVREDIYNIKLRMADIIAEYDKRRDYMDSLAIKYFLEQAQEKCQLGDYESAEKFYNLCYKVYPYSKVKIDWFIKATYDLIKLTKALDEHGKKIEELAASMSTATF